MHKTILEYSIGVCPMPTVFRWLQHVCRNDSKHGVSDIPMCFPAGLDTNDIGGSFLNGATKNPPERVFICTTKLD
jgi:hypothetical protein